MGLFYFILFLFCAAAGPSYLVSSEISQREFAFEFFPLINSFSFISSCNVSSL